MEDKATIYRNLEENYLAIVSSDFDFCYKTYTFWTKLKAYLSNIKEEFV